MIIVIFGLACQIFCKNHRLNKIINILLYMENQQIDALTQMPMRSIHKNNSHKSLYANSSSESIDHYQPKINKKQFQKPEQKQKLIKQEVIVNKKISNKLPYKYQQPLGFQQSYFDQYKDFTVKPLNFKNQQREPKFTSYGQRPVQFKPISQPTSEPMGINVRYSADRSYQYKKSDEIQYRQKLINSVHENRVLLSSQGGRWLKSLGKQSYNNATFLLKNYDRQNSRLQQEFDKIIKQFEDCNRKFKDFPFSINIYETKQLIQNQVKHYLESKLDMKTLKRDIPSIDWDQQKLKKYFTNYQPSSTELSYKMISEQPSVGLKKYKNCVYFGGVKDNKKEGYGVLIHYTNKRFEGTYKDDIKYQGLQIDDNEKEIYCGKFQKGIRSGKGILKLQNDIYYGEFKDGQFAGNGFKLQAEIISFFFNDNKMYIIKNNSGDIFVGDVLNNEKNGIGLERFSNLDIYIGNYQNNKPEGYGQYYWSNGAIYQGEFLSGLRHGKGKWYIRDGDYYQGQYMNDKKCGEGYYRWRNGTYYKGFFENDYRHGYGEMYWGDGKVYKGQWINGIEGQKRIQFEKQKRNTNKTILNREKSPKSIEKARLPILRNKTTSDRKQFLKKNSHLKNINKTIETKKNKNNDDPMNMTHRTIPRSGIKALFNPNFHFDN